MPRPNSSRRLRFFVTRAAADTAALVGCADGATTGAVPVVSPPVVVAGGVFTGPAGAGAGASAGLPAAELPVDDGGGAATGAETTAICSAVTGWNDASKV